MKKRILAILTVLVFALSILPSFAAMAATEAVATFEAENATSDVTTWKKTYTDDTTGETIVSKGSAAATFNFGIEYPAGEYTIKVIAGSNYGANINLNINGVAQSAVKVEAKKYGSFAYASFYELNLGTFTFTEEVNTVTLTIAQNIQVDKLIIEDSTASLPSIKGSNATLKIEAEDMDITGGYKKTFVDDANKFWIWQGTLTTSFVAEAGTYSLQIRHFSQYAKKSTITVNGVEAGTVTTGGWSQVSSSTLTTDMMKTNEIAVNLVNGKNTISITSNENAIDYIVISNVANYHEEVYSYSLTDANIRTGRRWGMEASYLGEYKAGDDSAWTSTLSNTTTKALSKADVSHVYYPFTTIVDSDYYVKVTYASAEASKAVLIVDPENPTENLPKNAYCNYEALGGTKIENGTWQSTYSGTDSKFTAPYFTEKIFYVGKLSGGSHNLAFVVDPEETENNGLAIRKVELISSDKIEKELYFTTTQMIAENVGAEVQTSALVTTPVAANEFSADSENDADKNAAATVGYIYNYTDDSVDIVYITASYNGGQLLDIAMNEAVTVAPGKDANLKAKVSTEAATGVVTFIWQAGTLVPMKEVALFGY